MDVAEKEHKFNYHMQILKEAKEISIRQLLLKIGDKYAGPETEKLRAEARDTFGIDSVHDYNFGITGQSGVGKSTLINAFCGYDDNDNRAAEVSIVECTEKMERYAHPDLKHLALYDLPGAGTTGHPSHTYFCDKRLYVFDCLLLVMSERIRENDLVIAKLAQEMGTPVVFVRNKAMNDLKTMQSKYEGMEEKELIENTISILKNNILDELKIAKIEDPKVFVIEAHTLGKLSRGGTHDNLSKLGDIMKFEEVDLLEHLTDLARPRSRFTLENIRKKWIPEKQHNPRQHSPTQHSPTQHNSTQHNPTQHSPTQHNPTHYNGYWYPYGYHYYCHSLHQ